jgi:hypothetical protein
MVVRLGEVLVSRLEEQKHSLNARLAHAGATEEQRAIASYRDELGRDDDAGLL